METVKVIKRIEAEMTNGKIYAYEVPSVKAIDSPSPAFYRVVFDDNQLELLFSDKMVRCKLWLKEVPKLVVPTTEEAVKVDKTKTKSKK